MRPTRLELQGFASFRDHTVVDFTDADLFALTGATGAGKSSIIDAMTFALYGSVARYGTKLVEPLISQGMHDARVLLEFTADDQSYRVARRVQRTATGGATTKEARLELVRPDEGADPIDLASGAKEVTAEVQATLGLSFEHFCRTVVLPQGSFQEFLHATAGEKQELLVQLLDLGIYRDIGNRARALAAETRATIKAHQPRLEELAGISEEAVKQAAQRLDAIRSVTEVVTRAQPELDAIRERGAEARAAQKQAKADLDRVAAIRRPDGLPDLAARLAEVDVTLARAQESLEVATTAREAGEDTASKGHDSKELRALADQRASLSGVLDQRNALSVAHEQPQTAAVAARKAAEEAQGAIVEREESVRHLEAAHGVHALREHLAEGEACPLCLQEVAVLPDMPVLTDLETARAALDQARGQARAADKEASQLEVAAAKAGAEAKAAAGRSTELQEALETLATSLGVPSDLGDDDLRSRIDEARANEQALGELRKAEREARAAVKEATAERTKLDGERQQALDGLRSAQAGVADLGAPATTDDVATSWDVLVDWAEQERPRREERVRQADQSIMQVTQEWTERNNAVLEACTRAGVTVGKDTTPTAAVAAAEADARSALERMRQQRQQAADLQAEVDRLKEQAEVAHLLGQLLNAKNFEQWLLARGLQRLVVGASSILGELSRGGYSLSLGEDNAFLVVDHRNAGEERHARSLSGGETFLASLALALSLAEHVTDLAAKGSARLESLFLDEGFGTLDADTLDVVADAIEELGAQRMVGVITHVRELAERVPVRFEVRKGPAGSTIERIDA